MNAAVNLQQTNWDKVVISKKKSIPELEHELKLSKASLLKYKENCQVEQILGEWMEEHISFLERYIAERKQSDETFKTIPLLI